MRLCDSFFTIVCVRVSVFELVSILASNSQPSSLTSCYIVSHVQRRVCHSTCVWISQTKLNSYFKHCPIRLLSHRYLNWMYDVYKLMVYCHTYSCCCCSPIIAYIFINIFDGLREIWIRFYSSFFSLECVCAYILRRRTVSSLAEMVNTLWQ